MLYVVATPIGNLKDITLRALDTLKDVDLIAAEDTRHTKKLLAHYDIHTPLVSYHDHNETAKASQLVKELLAGKNIALVSDAGTPGINDPGYRLITACRVEGIEVAVVPGACAAVAALSVSGLPTDQFTFKGFVPVKSAQKTKLFDSLKNQKGTVIFYESPHRLVKTLKALADVWPDAMVTVARELTKQFEEVRRGDPAELAAHFASGTVKGEIVLLISPSLTKA